MTLTLHSGVVNNNCFGRLTFFQRTVYSEVNRCRSPRLQRCAQATETEIFVMLFSSFRYLALFQSQEKEKERGSERAPWEVIFHHLIINPEVFIINRITANIITINLNII